MVQLLFLPKRIMNVYHFPLAYNFIFSYTYSLPLFALFCLATCWMCSLRSSTGIDWSLRFPRAYLTFTSTERSSKPWGNGHCCWSGSITGLTCNNWSVLYFTQQHHPLLIMRAWPVVMLLTHFVKSHPFNSEYYCLSWKQDHHSVS